VLCRILTELKLLNTPVGVIVLSAGVGNDVVGWILLALCVALVNAGSGITALWVLLIAVGYTLFLVYAVRPAFIWLLKRTGSFQNGPTQGVMVVTLLMVLISAFITSIIGIHPIFGSFVVGVIMPHDGGFAVKVTEKIEDLVSALLLPLYFALSGLSTNLGLLNNGITWAYVVGVIAVAFFGKMTGGTLAAKLCGLVWRESFAVGSLMSCKGLVELIVLNIGLQAVSFRLSSAVGLANSCPENPQREDLHNICGNGPGDHCHHHAARISPVSALVPGQAGRLEARGD
jgi:Kef-type K+ transport system membrane component KefB